MGIDPAIAGWLAAGAGGGLLALNAAIRHGLRAPRIANEHDPGLHGLAFHAVRLPTVRGRRIAAWLVPAADGATPSGPALIVLHGWGGNSAQMLPLAAPLHAAGLTLLFIDARCHGDSDADTFASLPRFAEDLECAFDWLRDRMGDGSGRIALLGHSVGAAAALLVAARRREVAAVVSVAAFAHPAQVMRRLLAAWRIPYLPVGWYVLRYVQRTIGEHFDAIAPERTIGRVRCPVLLVHGQDDATVPVEEARRIHAARGDAPARLLLVAGSHDDYEDLERRVGEVADFLVDALARAQS